MAIGDAPESSEMFLPAGTTWNANRRDATHSQRLAVAPPLALLNTLSGPVLTLNAAVGVWLQAVVTGPVEDGVFGRFLAKVINGPCNQSFDASFTAEDLGTVDDNQVVEISLLGSGYLHPGTPVIGLVADNRVVDDKVRAVLLVQRDGPFIVHVEKDGGSDGSRTTAASWTYTVRDSDGNLIEPNCELERERPIGTRNFAPADSRGLAIFHGGELILLDVFGEGYPTGGCA